MIDSIYTQQRDKIYSWVSEPEDVPKVIVENNNIVYYYDTGCEHGVVQNKINSTRIKKKLSYNMRKTILVRYVIGGEMWLQYLGGK